MPTELNVCALCGQKKSEAVGSLTQWIAICHCDMLDVDEELVASICAKCGERIGGGRVGSLTQWVFRNNLCHCEVPEPIVALAYSHRDAGKSVRHIGRETKIDGVVEESEVRNRKFEYEDDDDFDEEVVVDPSRFPVDRYRPLKTLGSGGAGTVFLCWDKHLEKKVAVKVLFDMTDEARVNFQKEAIATAKFKHANVISIIDFGVVDAGTPYMVLEYFAGFGLDRYLRQHGPPDLPLAIRFFIELADALAHGHAVNVFHRDIKCSNVLVVKDNSGNPTVKLIDFGIAAMISNQASTMVQGRTLVGTPKYMSPDQALGMIFDARSELYSLGCLMYEVLTGRVPFDGEDVLNLISMHSAAPVPAMSDMAMGNVPPIELENVVRKCLEKNPDDRYQSMEELKRALAVVQQDIEKADASMDLSKSASARVVAHVKAAGLSPRVALITFSVTLFFIAGYAMLLSVGDTVAARRWLRKSANQLARTLASRI